MTAIPSQSWFYVLIWLLLQEEEKIITIYNCRIINTFNLFRIFIDLHLIISFFFGGFFAIFLLLLQGFPRCLHHQQLNDPSRRVPPAPIHLDYTLFHARRVIESYSCTRTRINSSNKHTLPFTGCSSFSSPSWQDNSFARDTLKLQAIPHLDRYQTKLFEWPNDKKKEASSNEINFMTSHHFLF